MNRSALNQPSRNIAVGLASLVALAWFITGAVLSSRLQLVFTYQTIVTVPAAYEALAAPANCLSVLFISAILIPLLVYLRDGTSFPATRGLVFLSLACLPALLMLVRCFDESFPMLGVWELICFSLFSGLGFGSLVQGISVSSSKPAPSIIVNNLSVAFLWTAMLVACSWWFWQSKAYYDDFQLGFNDFGHFTQRIANTSDGRGFLLESPVLPIYWDHFNPAIACLAPLWRLWPDVTWVFLLQAFCLSIPAPLLYSIARKYGATSWISCGWSIAWLIHPSIGQMNLAYTYGWHPVTVAIPLLLLAFLFAMKNQMLLASFTLVFACLFEEGVIVVVACFAFAQFLRTRFRPDQACSGPLQWNLRNSLGVFVVASFAFVIVYLASGLASFQASRFLTLGNSTFEVILSPIFRPSVFWGLLFRERNLIFVVLILMPLMIGGLWRSPWHCLAIALPLFVLLIWEHMPAQSIAFQYASCLLPILFLGSIEGTHRLKYENVLSAHSRHSVVGCLVTCLTLSVCIGQFPWSRPSLVDVVSRTYGIVDVESRRAGSGANRWLLDEISNARQNKDSTILATGRIAAHCVGQADVETVGQFWQRYDRLAKLDPKLSSPILRYDFILLDYSEIFQQAAEESQRIRNDALRFGFVRKSFRHNIEVLTRP